MNATLILGPVLVQVFLTITVSLILWVRDDHGLNGYTA